MHVHDPGEEFTVLDARILVHPVASPESNPSGAPLGARRLTRLPPDACCNPLPERQA